MKIASSPTRDKYPLDPKKIIKKTLTSSIILTIIILVGYAFVSASLLISSQSGLFGIVSAAVFVFLAVLILIIYLYQRWYFAVYYYNLDGNYIVIKKGPITPREITIPYERVQDVYVDQDIFDRLLNIYDVHLSSATISSGMEAHIDGVAKPAADGLRQLLLDTVSQKLNRSHQQPPTPQQ